MSNASRCPKCQRPVDANAVAGLCPACLLQAGLNAASATTTPFGGAFTAPPLAELAEHFPHLELLELLGQGGMGAVYKARQTRLGRLVALKILPKTTGQEAAFAERFAREAQALARLSHPSIITIHDYGEAGGWFYFIMEFVDGINLRQAIRAKSVEPLRLSPSSLRFATPCSTPTRRASSTATSSPKTSCWTSGAA